VRGQSILGTDEFVDDLIDQLGEHKNIPDIPKSQRYLHRPLLEKIFYAEILLNKGERDKKIVEAVEKHGYKQREVADRSGYVFYVGEQDYEAEIVK
jgi:hypothetical protein